MIIDVRSDNKKDISEIWFADESREYAYKLTYDDANHDYLEIADSDNGIAYVYLNDIDSLIKALTKAQEVWS